MAWFILAYVSTAVQSDLRLVTHAVNDFCVYMLAVQSDLCLLCYATPTRYLSTLVSMKFRNHLK